MTRLPFGFGTANFESFSATVTAVERALEVGYRHFDTADHYQHTEAIPTAVEDSSVSREDLFLASKLHSEQLDHDSVIEATERIRSQLDVDTIDLLYVHWPTDTYDPVETFQALATVRDRGQVRHVGVCNFTPELLREAADHSPVPLLAHQFELHPFLPQRELTAVTRELGVQAVAHSPLAGGHVFESDVLRELADCEDTTVARLVLGWLSEHRSVCPVPKATGDHIAENFVPSDGTVSPETFERIDAITHRHRVVDYDFAPWHD